MSYLRLLSEFSRSRSRKRHPRLPAVHSTAVVNTDLNPGGSVLANGELWHAQSFRGNSIARQTEVTVVAFRDHLLLVETKQ